MSRLTLDAPIDTLAGIGPKRAALLARLGVATVRDLVFHIPRDYQDRRQVTPVAAVREGDTVTIAAEVVKTRLIRLRGRKSLAEITLRDETGEIKATWFGRGFLATAFRPGSRALFTGRAGRYQGLALQNPDYEMLTGGDEDRLHTGRLAPIYPLTERITQRMLRGWIHAALAELETPPETLPGRLRKRRGLPGAGAYSGPNNG